MAAATQARELLHMRGKGSTFTASVREPSGQVVELPLRELVRTAPLSRWRNPKAELRHLRTLHRFLAARAVAPELTFRDFRHAA